MAAAGNSRFAVTCGLLRQYMRKEQQQQLGGLDAAFRPPPLVEAAEEAEETDGRTMQLFPTRAGTGTSSSSFLQPSQQERLPEAQAKGTLTIVYDGRVVVLEDFPADKAKELMQMAGSSRCSPAANNGGAPAVAEKPAAAARPSPAVPSDLPIARKVSLKRFLQKRKERIGAIEPYPKVTATSSSPAAENDVPAARKTGTTTVKDKPAASWLGL